MNDVPEALPILVAGARDIAMLSNAERIRHIRSDRWINYTRTSRHLSGLKRY